MQRLAQVVCILTTVAATLCAQIGGPISGYLYDARGTSIRPVRGLAGAALLGEPIGPSGLQASVTAPGKNFSLVIREDPESPLALLRLLGTDAPEMVALTAISAKPDLLSISRDGGAAIAYFDAARALYLIRGLPDSPTVSAPADVASVGRIEAAAVDHDGRLLIAAERDGSRSLYYSEVDAEGRFAPRLISVHAASLAVAINAEGTRAAFADRGSNQIFLIDDLPGSATVRPIAGATEGVDGPMAIAITGELVIVANETTPGLLVIPFANGQVRAMPLHMVPACLEPLTSHLFALNRPGKGPVFLFDANSLTISFVPADAPSAEGGIQ